MTALYRAGRQGDALRAYQRARRVIGEELGIEPGRALQDLEERILRQSLDVEPTVRPHPPLVVGQAPEPTAGEPLVGRDAEVERLRDAVVIAVEGRGRTVVIHGEPGIGKTRLAREAGRLAAEAGALVGQGGCVEGHVTAAYWPWTNALRGLLEGMDPATIPPAVRLALAELAQLDPALGRWAAGASAAAPPADPELARARLQRAAVDTLVGLGRLRPVTVVLEDLQWADPSSLQLLSLAAPEAAAAPVLTVVTYREQEVDTALAATLAALGRVASTVDVSLGGLDAPSVHRFVEVTAGEDVSEAVAASIATRTAGNPLFVAELTRLLRSERALHEEGVRHAPVPAGVRDVIRRRLERLPAQTTTVLTVAAVLGRRFDLAVLERVAQLPEDELLERVESAVAVGLVGESDGQLGTFGFTHDLVRDTLKDGVSGTRRARLHARVAQALLDCGIDGDPARPFEVAHHLMQALPLLPAEQVAPHVVAAADAAAARLAFEQAEDQLRRALALVDLLPGEGRPVHELAVRVRLARAITVTRGHAWPEVREHTARAVELAGEVDPRPEVMQALWAVAVNAGVAGEFGTALAVSRKLLGWGEEQGDAAALFLGHSALGAFSWALGDVDAGVRHSALSVEVADSRELDRRLVYDAELWSGASGRTMHALAAWLAGRGEAEALMADARRRAEGTGSRTAIAYVACFDGCLGVLRGDRVHGRCRAREAIEVADAIGYHQFSLMGRAMLAAASEDPGTRSKELQDVVEGWTASGARIYLPLFLTLQAEAELERGQAERAAALLARALEVVTATGERFYEPEMHRLLGVVARQGGRRDEAATHFERGCQVVRELGLAALQARLAGMPERGVQAE